MIVDKKVHDVRTTMQESTVGWISSIGSEFIARVAYEFLLCGTPIAVSKAGSLPEALGFDGAGVVCDVHDPKLAAMTLAKLIASSQKENSEAKQKRSRSSTEIFGLNAMSKKINSLLVLS